MGAAARLWWLWEPQLTEQIRQLSGAPRAELEGVLRAAVRGIQEHLEGQIRGDAK